MIPSRPPRTYATVLCMTGTSAINGRALAALIKEKGLDNSKLGRRMGLKSEGRQVRRWISGEVVPEMATIVKIAEALEMDPPELINRLFALSDEGLRRGR